MRPWLVVRTSQLMVVEASTLERNNASINKNLCNFEVLRFLLDRPAMTISVGRSSSRNCTCGDPNCRRPRSAFATWCSASRN